MRSWNTQRAVILGFLAVAAVFVGATGYTQLRSARIDEDALSIATNAAPSIQHLAAARAEIHAIQVSLQHLLDHPDAQAVESLRSAQRTLELELSAYLGLAVYPGDREAFAHAERVLGVFNAAVERTELLARSGDLVAARQALTRDVTPSVDAARAALNATVEINAALAQRLALNIERNRGLERWAAYGLDAVGLLLTLAALLATLRVFRRHAALQEAHRALLERRAEELESFASRVAHDILSPLNPVALFLQLAEPALAGDPKLARSVDRARSGLMRAKRIVNDLLDFARAGARPASTARAEVDEVLADLEKELVPEAVQLGAELTFSAVPATVAASPGVVTSVVQNLVRNALKYLGTSRVRQVRVVMEAGGGRMRVEVRDTGPGLPPGMEASVFEPYVRAPGVTQPGIGLGLAIVQKLVTAHGGRVGVESRPGAGCTFWFELPTTEPGRRRPPRARGESRLSGGIDIGLLARGATPAPRLTTPPERGGPRKAATPWLEASTRQS